MAAPKTKKAKPAAKPKKAKSTSKSKKSKKVEAPKERPKFPVGNRFWQVRAKHGRDKIFSSPQMLWDAASEYFEWVETNPLWEGKVAQYEGCPVEMQIPKMRAMTLVGLARFLHIDRDTWYAYARHSDFSDICKVIEDIIYDQKFVGATAGLLNASIIQRDLGLVDKKELSGDAENPIVTKTIDETMDPKAAAIIYRALMKGAVDGD